MDPESGQANVAQAGKMHVSSGWSCRPIQRRSHKKSRNGCQTCKTRRVKCDEAKPACGNCIRSCFTCDFAAAKSVPLKTTELQRPVRKRGRPRKVWPAKLPSPEAESNSNDTGSDTRLSPSAPALNVDDLQLLHHYMSDEPLTSDDDLAWRNEVPSLSFDHHYDLRLILAFSALHLARLKPTEAAKYENLAEAHLLPAIREVMDLLPHINNQNCSALYVATVLICRCIFAKTPRRGDLLVVANDSQVAWWEMFRGVRYVIETMGADAVLTGPLAPSTTQEKTQDTRAMGRKDPQIDWEEPLGELANLATRYDKPYQNLLESVHQALSDSFRAVFGTAEEPELRTLGKTPAVMRWLYFIEDDFIAPFKEKSPPALILLAYFAVLLQTLDHIWYMKGWAKHILEGVREAIDTRYAAWLLWPTKQLQVLYEDGKNSPTPPDV
ncbi:Sterol uptake control protein [Paramyrothecium foliicola]|nr:Sterol uptake control protein [Paramyrothecium foliicola]